MSSIPRRLVEPGLSICRPDDRGLCDLGTALTGAGIVANLVGGKNSSDAAQSAAQTQADSASAGIAEQRRQFDLTRQDNAPFLSNGTAANQRLATLLGISTTGAGNANWQSSYDKYYKQMMAQADADHMARYGIPLNQSGDTVHLNSELEGIKNWASQMADGDVANQPAQTADPAFGSLTRNFSQSDINADPVYQSGLKFGLDQGTNAINARAIASGGYDSGATLKALTQWGNDYGSTKANDSFNRFQTQNTNTYNRLAGVSGAGQTAANTVASAGANMANNVSNLTTDAGNARAAGIVGSANAWGSAAQGVGSAVNNYNSQQTLKALLSRSGSIPTSGGYQPSNFTYTGYGANGDYQYG